MNAKIMQLLTQLKLFGMQGSVIDILQNTEKNGLATEDFLLELLEAEYRNKQARCLSNRIYNAKFPWNWALDTFPFQQQPGINKTQIMNLAKLHFIERRENVIFIGKPGTGKSGLAMGLLRQAILNGYCGRFYNAQDMLNELYTSLADKMTSRLFKKLFKYDLLVIDELGYLTLNTEQVNMFFKLIDIRYGKKPTIITTNLSFNDWYDIFKQKELVDALLDRFKHYCIVINIDGPSLRTPSESTTTENDLPQENKKS